MCAEIIKGSLLGFIDRQVIKRRNVLQRVKSRHACQQLLSRCRGFGRELPTTVALSPRPRRLFLRLSLSLAHKCLPAPKITIPTWLAPTQVKVLPVSEKTLDYARAVNDSLKAAGIRAVLDESNEKIGYKIRQAQQVDRVPYMLVLGAKEVEANNISVRDRQGETTTMDLEAFTAKVVGEIKDKTFNV